MRAFKQQSFLLTWTLLITVWSQWMPCHCTMATTVNVTNRLTIWEHSSIPAVNTIGYVSLKVELINPCDLLSELSHHQLKKDSLEKCQQMYNEYMLQPLKDMCPGRPREERFIVLVAGFFTLFAIVAVGFTTAVLDSSSRKVEKINNLGQVTEQLNNATRRLEQSLNKTTESVNPAREKFNMMLAQIKRLSTDYTDFRSKIPQTLFETSNVVAKLMHQNKKLLKAARLWRSGRMSEDLLEAFDLYGNWSEKVPIELAKPHGCFFTDSSKVEFKFVAPYIDEDMAVMKARSFKMLIQHPDDTANICEAQIPVPSTILVSKSNKCAAHANIESISSIMQVDKNLASQYVFFNGNLTCKSESQINNGTSISDLSKRTTNNTKSKVVFGKCWSTESFNYEDFVQVKFANDNYYVYCFGLNITIRKTVYQCPNNVIVIPFGVRFSVGKHRIYEGSAISRILRGQNQLSNIDAPEIAEKMYSSDVNVTRLIEELKPFLDMMYPQESFVDVRTMIIGGSSVGVLCTSLVILFICKRRSDYNTNKRTRLRSKINVLSFV